MGVFSHGHGGVIPCESKVKLLIMKVIRKTVQLNTILLLLLFAVMHLGAQSTSELNQGLAGLFLAANTSSPQTGNFEADQIFSGKEKLLKAIKEVDTSGNPGESIKIKTRIDDSLANINREAYEINFGTNSIEISGGSGAGVLYGCREAASIILKEKKLPSNHSVNDAPAMDWRGISLQLMKLGEYNFAITPEEFPFFYDKTLWLEFLDFMADQRFNYIILWNGHPFDYFVKFDKYPEAQSGIYEGQIQQNNDMLHWLIAEGGKRNIKFLFEFYNIHTSVYYQEAHNLPKHISKPTPELAAYTKYSISRFVSEFPEVGLFITPGEALELEYSVDWINEVIFDAVKSTGFNPAIFMRGWSFELEEAGQIVDAYPGQYFVRKFNVEMIADTRVDPENVEWAKLNGNFIVNVHLAANLEPFRWNPPEYIQEIVRNNIKSGANGIHLHPRKAWRWPYGSDAGIKEYQWRRDTMFFTAWSRYSWNPEREPEADGMYWENMFTSRYGNKEAGKHFLNSSEAGADVLPSLQRLIWLGNSNHSIVTAGLTLQQLQNARGIPFLDISPTLRPVEYVEALKTGEVIEGVTPIEFVEKLVADAEEALKEAKLGASIATEHVVEANRIVNDAEAIRHTVNYHFHKLLALKTWVLLGEGINPNRNKKLFIDLLSESVKDFELLCKTTESTYESLSDVPAWHPVKSKKAPYHWNDLLSLYTKELHFYSKELQTEYPPEYYQPSLAGLAGILYSNAHFMDAQKSYPTEVIDYNWDNDEEIGRNWAIKWFGFLKAPVSAEAKLFVSCDRDLKVKIGDKLITLNKEVSENLVEEIEFEQGKFYSIEILYDHDGIAGGHIKLEWSWDNHSRELIPKENLFHSEAQKNKTELLSQMIRAMNEGVE